jgi:hypothetical protein
MRVLRRNTSASQSRQDTCQGLLVSILLNHSLRSPQTTFRTHETYVFSIRFAGHLWQTHRSPDVSGLIIWSVALPCFRWTFLECPRNALDSSTSHYKDWVVTREVCHIFEYHQWQWCRAGEDYMKALWPSFGQSVHLELGFNDSRDNEVRGARHKQRSSSRIQARLLRSSLACKLDFQMFRLRV